MADIQQELEASIQRVSEGIDLLKEEDAELRARLEFAKQTISQLRAELEYERSR